MSGQRIHIHGTAAMYGQRTQDGRRYPVRFGPRCFQQAAGSKQIQLRINHDPGTEICSTSDALSVWETDGGLHFMADLPDSPGARKLVDKIQSGELSGASVLADGPCRLVMDGDRRIEVMRTARRITDVSLVDQPGNPHCTARVVMPWEHREQPLDFTVDRSELARQKALVGIKRERLQARQARAGKKNVRITNINPTSRPKKSRKAGFLFDAALLADIRRIHTPVHKLARRQGLSTEQLMAQTGRGISEVSGSLLYEQDAQSPNGWKYIGR